MTLQEVTNQLSISRASAHQILREKIGMRKVSDGWVTKQLTEDQKASRVTVAKEHLRRINSNENMFLNCIFTSGEMWVPLRKHAYSNILKILPPKN